jgi:hypothetical protein
VENSIEYHDDENSVEYQDQEQDDDAPINQIPAAALEAYVAQMATQNQKLPIIRDLMNAVLAMRQSGALQVPQEPPQQPQVHQQPAPQLWVSRM